MKVMCVQFAKVVSGVAPLVGAWIESVCLKNDINNFKVAPLVGAWIERSNNKPTTYSRSVAPLVGAWIESR